MKLQDFTIEEQAMVKEAFKLAKVPMKHLASVADVMLHDEDVIELWWRTESGNSVSIDNQGYQMAFDGDEKFIGSSTAKNIIQAITEGKHDDEFIDSMIEQARAKE